MEASMASPGPEARAHPDSGFFKAVFINLREGARVAYFRPFSGDVFQVGAWHMVVLAVIDVAISITYDYASVAPERYFSTRGFMDTATAYLLFVFAVFAIDNLLSGKGGTPRVVVTVLSIGPALSVVALPLTYASLQWQTRPLSWLIGLALAIWFCAILYRVFRERYEIGRVKTLPVVLFFLLLSEGPRSFLGEEPFWYSFNLDDYKDTETINAEDTYYAQPALLSRAASHIEPQRPGIVDLYFVGFGSYARQDVFMHEVNYVRDLFDTRFDTRGRSVALINNEKTVDHTPLANGNNLRITLENVAARMDKEEDVLFLFLTSHGSDDAVLSVDFWPLGLNSLSAGDLHEALAASGIKWRILVISACYSGSFIEPLLDDHTLILTAAAKDKMSFGCSHDRNMTYFGEHYFAQALADSDSFVTAFHRAKVALHEREVEEEIDPSDPQMFMGEAMAAKLTELEARLRAASAVVAHAEPTPSTSCGERGPLTDEALASEWRQNVIEDQTACVQDEGNAQAPER